MVEFCPMKAFKYVKKVAPVLALAMAALFAGCSNSSGGGGGNPIPQGYYSTSGMTQTQTAAASEGKITVNPTTKTLAITGAAGKTFYMVRANIRDTKLEKNNLRYIPAPSASATQAQIAASAQALQDAFDMQEKDPRALIEERSLEAISKMRFSKNAAPAIQASQSPSIGDTDEFLQILDMNSDVREKGTFKLIHIDNDGYNLWVKADDPFYVGKESDFLTNAIKALDQFKQGYKLESHIYGELTDKLWGKDAAGRHVEAGDMSKLSKYGEKINILFYSMLNKNNPDAKIKGVNGFVSHADIYYDPSYQTSNNGRFIYIDSSEIMEDLGTVYTTMFHECSHSITYNKKTIKNNIYLVYWYSEMLAMLCEDMMQEYLGVTDDQTSKSKAIDGASFLGTTPKNRLSRANMLGGTFGLTGQSADLYSEAYELGAWLVRRFGGIKLLKEIATNAKVDWDSIISAVNAVNGTSYTVENLIWLLAEDMLEQKTDAGLNKDSQTYENDPELYCENNGSKYLYKFTAIDLWNSNQFYDWFLKDYEAIAKNEKRSSSGVPDGNIYYEANPTHENVFAGPCIFTGAATGPIGPYGYILAKIGKADQDTVTITFACDGEQFGDSMTIFVK